METAQQELDVLEDALNSGGLTGLARALAVKCANKIISTEANRLFDETSNVRSCGCER